MNLENTKSFVIEYNGISQDIKTSCGIDVPISQPIKTNQSELKGLRGLWDTGATATVISKEVANQLGLMPSNYATVHHANGQSSVPVYYVSVFLPCGVVFPCVRVTEGILSGCDVLIGMDIISRGDFAITASKGKTKFSFQLPSTHDIDFVKEYNTRLSTKDKVPGRNDSCLCGSDKKYKHCCME